MTFTHSHSRRHVSPIRLVNDMKNPKIRPKRHVGLQFNRGHADDPHVERLLLKRSRYRWNYCYMRWGHARSDQLLVACERTAGNRASPVIRSVRTWLAERTSREKFAALIDQGSNGPE